MQVQVETPDDYQGFVAGDLSSRRGLIQGSEAAAGETIVNAQVPLSEMFGYSTDLRSGTAGKATYSMNLLSTKNVLKISKLKLLKLGKKTLQRGIGLYQVTLIYMGG